MALLGYFGLASQPSVRQSFTNPTITNPMHSETCKACCLILFYLNSFFKKKPILKENYDSMFS